MIDNYQKSEVRDISENDIFHEVRIIDFIRYLINTNDINCIIWSLSASKNIYEGPINGVSFILLGKTIDSWYIGENKTIVFNIG